MSTRLIPPPAQPEVAEPVDDDLWRRACEKPEELAAVNAALASAPLAFWVERAILPQCDQGAQLVLARGFASALARSLEPWQAVWYGALAIAEAREAAELDPDSEGSEPPVVSLDQRDYEETLTDLLQLAGRRVELRLELGGSAPVRLQAAGELTGTLDASLLAGATDPGLRRIHDRMTESPTFRLDSGASFLVPKAEFSHAFRERALCAYSLVPRQSIVIVTAAGATVTVDDPIEEAPDSGPSIERALEEGWR
jgi:hypothetical protein